MPHEEKTTAHTEQPQQVPRTEFAPFSEGQWIPLLWVIAIASLGGLASFLRKRREGAVRPFNFTELLGELVWSILAGLATYWLCRGFGIGEWETAAAIAVSGHMGTRALFLLEKWAETRFTGIVGNPKQGNGD